MAPRRILGEITPNRRPRTELSTFHRGVILGWTDCGVKPALIARQLHLPDSTVRTTIKKATQRANGESKTRSGAPQKVNTRDKRAVIRSVKATPKMTYSDLCAVTGLNVCDKTLAKIMKKENIKNWQAKKCPFLKEEHAVKRLAFALQYKDWTWEE